MLELALTFSARKSGLKSRCVCMHTYDVAVPSDAFLLLLQENSTVVDSY